MTDAGPNVPELLYAIAAKCDSYGRHASLTFDEIAAVEVVRPFVQNYFGQDSDQAHALGYFLREHDADSWTSHDLLAGPALRVAARHLNPGFEPEPPAIEPMARWIAILATVGVLVGALLIVGLVVVFLILAARKFPAGMQAVSPFGPLILAITGLLILISVFGTLWLRERDRDRRLRLAAPEVEQPNRSEESGDTEGSSSL